MTNATLLGVLLLGRHYATKSSAPRLLYSMAACSIPYFALITTSRLDNQDELLGHRFKFYLKIFIFMLIFLKFSFKHFIF